MFRIIFVFTLCVFSFSPAHSAVILKVKGRKALVDLEGVAVEKGDKFDALNLYGKPLGVLEIKKIKRGKAIAVLLKGKMGVSWILEPSAQESASAFSAEDEYDPVDSSNTYSSNSASSTMFSKGSGSSSGVGLILGAHFNRITVSANKSIGGTSLQEMLIVDFSLIGPLSARLFIGHQTLVVAGNNCGLSRCNLLIHYPGAGFLLRGIFLKNSIFQPWLGAGGFLFWPLVDKQANLGLDPKSFGSFHGALTGAAGIDLHFDGFYIPIQVEASWINPVLISLQTLKQGSKEFKPFYIGAKLGIAFSF